ncbi:hypothetical protein JN00_0348 [Metamycoplasma subdolum]|uniref:Lipoprotein n=1 Tax=Metamycoplasma subdolum TaxID=92407 RepID=A0A3M0A6T2_9BACT|nr:hypothetical protein [Metamycoplasma subdolum]RMA78518.1 hypothetical protein JN00_0348 [Metamycoplasma subdolum]WPB50450.1 hypothetical protein R9C05_02485 [Metamycoplasma subdolum]
MNKIKKITLALFAISSLTIIPALAISCKPKEERKLDKALKENRKQREEFHKRNPDQPVGYVEFEKLVRDSIQAELKVNPNNKLEIYAKWTKNVEISTNSIKQTLQEYQ